MLVLDRLGKIYPNGVNALERFSAEIRLGEIVAIIGAPVAESRRCCAPSPASTAPQRAP